MSSVVLDRSTPDGVPMSVSASAPMSEPLGRVAGAGKARSSTKASHLCFTRGVPNDNVKIEEAEAPEEALARIWVHVVATRSCKVPGSSSGELASARRPRVKSETHFQASFAFMTARRFSLASQTARGCGSIVSVAAFGADDSRSISAVKAASVI